jgi:integrase
MTINGGIAENIAKGVRMEQRQVVRIGTNLVLRGEIAYARLKEPGRRVMRWVRAPMQGQSAPGFAGAWSMRAGAPVATKALERWRDELANDMRTDRWDRAHAGSGRPSGAPSLDRMLEVYADLAASSYAERDSPRPATAHECAAKLRMIAGDMGVGGADPVDRLTADAVRRWVRGRVDAAEADQRDRARYSAWRTLAQARSVWAAWTLDGYRQAGLALPAGLMEWPKAGRGAAQAPQYQDPPDELKRRTVEALDRLEQENPTLWLAATLMLECSMRPCDARALQWEAFEVRDGAAWLRYVPSKTRGRTREVRAVELPIDPELLARMRRANPEPGHVVPAASETARWDLFKRDLNGWMRGLGWDRELYRKGAYELRKLSVSAALNSAGIEWAAARAGDNPETVRKYYAAMYRRRMPMVDTRATILAATKG